MPILHRLAIVCTLLCQSQGTAALHSPVRENVERLERLFFARFLSTSALSGWLMNACREAVSGHLRHGEGAHMQYITARYIHISHPQTRPGHRGEASKGKAGNKGNKASIKASNHHCQHPGQCPGQFQWDRRPFPLSTRRSIEKLDANFSRQVQPCTFHAPSRIGGRSQRLSGV